MPKSRTRDYPSLIQRVFRENRTAGTGIDSKFSYDYMGSAEFEFGTVHYSLIEMRQLGKFPAPRAIRVGKKTAWFLGPKESFGLAQEITRDQLTYKRILLKESTYMKESFDDCFEGKKVDAWWVLTHPPFVIFREKANAELWKKLLDAGKPQNQ